MCHSPASFSKIFFSHAKYSSYLTINYSTDGVLVTRTWAAGLQAQTNPLSYGSNPCMTVFLSFKSITLRQKAILVSFNKWKVWRGRTNRCDLDFVFGDLDRREFQDDVDRPLDDTERHQVLCRVLRDLVILDDDNDRCGDEKD